MTSAVKREALNPRWKKWELLGGCDNAVESDERCNPKNIAEGGSGLNMRSLCSWPREQCEMHRGDRKASH